MQGKNYSMSTKSKLPHKRINADSMRTVLARTRRNINSQNKLNEIIIQCMIKHEHDMSDIKE